MRKYLTNESGGIFYKLNDLYSSKNGSVKKDKEGCSGGEDTKVTRQLDVILHSGLHPELEKIAVKGIIGTTGEIQTQIAY